MALQYHECELVIRPGPNAYVGPNGIKVYANAIFLDTEDREWWVNQTHDLLISQVQKIPMGQSECDLSYLNHPVKTLLWGIDTADTLVTNDVKLTVNGVDVYDSAMPAKFFTTVQCYNQCDACPNASTFDDTSLYMQSFARHPNRHQPTGSLNFSRLDNAVMKYTMSGGTYPSWIYGVNYNILTIKSGMGGVKFSN